jgi:MoaA/NifB/PqqE/SkfB family radical SAM enzyme
MGTTTYVFVGGEPLESKTKKDIVSVIESNPQVVFYVCTNGFNVDNSISMGFSKSRNLVIALSVDGFRKNNDLRRGDGAFDAFVEASKTLRKYKNAIGAYIAINSLNFREVSSQKFIDFLISLGIKYATFSRHFQDNSELCATDEQFVRSLKGLYELAKGSPIVLMTPYLGDLAKPSLKNRHRTLLVGRHGSIKLGRNGPSFGNIKDFSLEEILSKPGFLEAARRRDNFEAQVRDGNMVAFLQELES